MKVLIINGSPKREDSVTYALTKSFVEGIQYATEAEIETIHIIDKRVEACSGCCCCLYNGGVCHIKDDMNEIANKILASDIVIFSFPIYAFAMPGQMKLITDRMLRFFEAEIEQVSNHYEHRMKKSI